MYGLPLFTELNRQLPKKAIFDKFKLNAKDRAKFDADIRKLTIVAEISPTTVNIAPGESVSVFYVVQVSLRREDYDSKTVITLSKLIDQNMLFVLEHEDKARLAVSLSKIIQSAWSPIKEINLSLSGLNLDAVWENLIIHISGVQLEQGNTLDEQLSIDETRAKLQRQIEKLEKRARSEKQPHKKFDLVQEIMKLQKELGVCK